MIFSILSVPVAAQDFRAWLSDFRLEAARAGIRLETLAALNGLAPDDKVIALDGKQPEHRITFAQYSKTALSQQRIKQGRALLAEHKALLKRAAARTGVQPKYLVALWGIESNFGKLSGSHSVLRSLATLGWEGRRARFFRSELLAALRVIDGDHIAAADLRGSWAGAMGQCQFMPSTFLAHAVDGDGDGRRDIWNNLPDVFASIGNYLRAEGWRPGLIWGGRVRLARAIPEKYVGLDKSWPLDFWKKRGVRVDKGSAILRHAKAHYYLVQPDGAAGASYLVTANYKALMRWNRSTYFATAVGLLADSLD